MAFIRLDQVGIICLDPTVSINVIPEVGAGHRLSHLTLNLRFIRLVYHTVGVRIGIEESKRHAANILHAHGDDLGRVTAVS